MNCHNQVLKDDPRLALVRESAATGKPIPWVQIHKTPDYVYFNHSIHVNNVSRIKARLISCGANVPATREAEKHLWQRGILCVPDFVSNAGGVLGGTMEFAGVSPSVIVKFVDRHFSRQVSAMIEKARREGLYIRDVAEEVAFLADGADYDLLMGLADDLRFVTITSAAQVERASGETRVEVAALGHDKCERCWHVRPDVSADPAHPGLCGRCVSNLFGEGEAREHA